MKTYEETAERILNKLNEKTAKRKRTRKITAALIALALIVGSAAGVNAIMNKAPVLPPSTGTDVQDQTAAAPILPTEENVPGGIWLTPAPPPEADGDGRHLSIVAFVVYNGKTYVADGQQYIHAGDWEKVPVEARRISAMMSDNVTDWKDAWLSPNLLSDAQWNAFVGEQLGIASGNVTYYNILQKEEEGYAELDGSLKGPIYAVNGYSTEDALCFIQKCDAIGYYDTYTIHNGYRELIILRALSGFSVENGADFFQDHLHTDHTVAYQYVTDYDWQYGHTTLSFDETDLSKNAIRDVPLSDETMKAFMDALYASPAVADAVGTIGNTPMRHLFLLQANGTYEILHLFEGGFVACTAYYPNHTVYIAMDPDGVFNTVWNGTE